MNDSEASEERMPACYQSRDRAMDLYEIACEELAEIRRRREAWLAARPAQTQRDEE